MEHDFCCIILLVVVSICNGENCQAHYKFNPICGAYYGIVLNTYLGIRSVTECAARCSNEDLCRSVIYHSGQNKCRTNTEYFHSPVNNCTEMVLVYAALDTFEVSMERIK